MNRGTFKKPQWRILSLPGEDKVRLLGYFFAFAWPIMFQIVQPVSYNVVSDVIIHVFMSATSIGAIAAIFGVLTGISLKLELPALYAVLIGPIVYLFAQIGFMLSGNPLDFNNRFALSGFVLWHIALMLSRIVGLESYRRRELVKVKALAALKVKVQ